jgi:hypothetical protein
MEDFQILKTIGPQEAPDILLPRIRRRVVARRIYRVSASLLLVLMVFFSLFLVQRMKQGPSLAVKTEKAALDTDIVDLGSPFLQIGAEDSLSVYEIDVAVAGPMLEI